MPVPYAPILFRAAVEVRYDEGVVYFDKCGSLTRDLHRVLGKSFKFTLPAVQQGQMQSISERMAVAYGTENTTIVQEAVQDIARFVQVAAWTWQTVGSALEITKKVKRCGIRFQQLFPTQTPDEAEQLLFKSGLVRETPLWAEILGPPTVRAFIAHVNRSGWSHIRVELSKGELKDVEAAIPVEVKSYYPPHAVSFDMDFVLIDKEQSELRHVDLKENILRAFGEATHFAGKVAERMNK